MVMERQRESQVGCKLRRAGGSRTVLLLGRCAALWSRSGESSVSDSNSCMEKMKEIASLLVNCSLGLRTRWRVYETCMRSALLYGTETWALTRKLMFYADVIAGCWVTWQEWGGKTGVLKTFLHFLTSTTYYVTE